ncbi:MAG: hypothetical protein ACRC8S_04635 [Fimbriiglobus sp.]
MNVSLRITIFSLLTLAFVIGCGGSSTPIEGAPQAHPVSGVLTMKGAPMAGAIITFYPLASKGKYDAAPSAIADQDGRYKLTTYSTGDGAPTGEYRVTIYWPGKRRGTPNEEGDLPPDQLKEVYAGKTTSKLKATVEARENTIDFKLP